MRAMILEAPGRPLAAKDVEPPRPGAGQVLIRVAACAVCRTDLHVCDGELPNPKLPLTPGHEIVGHVVANGLGAERFAPGTRVGVPWLGWTCGVCKYCRSGQENLCDQAKFTGYTLDGGYADFVVANENYCFELPRSYADEQAAPLLCAGLIGYRCWKKTNRAEKIGLFGFGAAAHIIIQVARFKGQQIFGFTRRGDVVAQRFATELGAVWAGNSDERPPVELDAAIIFAPVGALIPYALQCVRKGGIVVCGGIHMSEIPSFPYSLLWNERTVTSVANLTRKDGEEFFAIAQNLRIHTRVHAFPLTQANEALNQLRRGEFSGAAVLLPEQPH